MPRHQPTLSFSLNLEGVARVHDAVQCLAKFSDLVSLEARSTHLTLTALNSSKSAYASFALDCAVFFEKYAYGQKEDDGERHFTCQLYNKALLSIFKGRLIDRRDNETAVERCEVVIPDERAVSECRIIVKMICRHGVTKTYKLTYESVKIEHAMFNHNTAKNTWRIGANVLRSFLDYFGATTEQLDIYVEDGRVAFTSYTEKVTNGKEILKQPMETSIALDTLDFENFSVEDKMHIAISVKDFKALIMHAETLRTSVQAHYSSPRRPMQISYQEHGMQCEFTLMTIGDYRGSSVTPAPITVRKPSATPSENPASRQVSVQPSQNTRSEGATDRARETMPPPSQPVSRSFAAMVPSQPDPQSLLKEGMSQKPSRPSPPPPKASLDPESLFLPAGDDDRQWDETNYDDEEDTLGWDASAIQVGRIVKQIVQPLIKIGSKGPSAFNSIPKAAEDNIQREPLRTWPEDNDRPIGPTQRLSEIDTLFSQ